MQVGQELKLARRPAPPQDPPEERPGRFTSCPHCWAEVRPHDHFRGNRGADLEGIYRGLSGRTARFRCPSCERPAPGDALRCPRCQHPLAASEPAGEQASISRFPRRGWISLSLDDPRQLGPYALFGRLDEHGSPIYLGHNEPGEQYAAARPFRHDARPETVNGLRTEAEALRRIGCG